MGWLSWFWGDPGKMKANIDYQKYKARRTCPVCLQTYEQHKFMVNLAGGSGYDVCIPCGGIFNPETRQVIYRPSKRSKNPVTDEKKVLPLSRVSEGQAGVYPFHKPDLPRPEPDIDLPEHDCDVEINGAFQVQKIKSN